MKKILLSTILSISLLSADILNDLTDGAVAYFSDSYSSFSSNSLGGILSGNLGNAVVNDAWKMINMCYQFDGNMNFDFDVCGMCNSLDTKPLCPDIDISSIGLTTSNKKNTAVERYSDSLKNYCKMYCGQSSRYADRIIDTVEDALRVRTPSDIYRIGSQREEILEQVSQSTEIKKENIEFLKAVANDPSGAVLREYVEAAMFSSSQGKLLTPSQFVSKNTVITPPFKDRKEMEKLIEEEAGAKAVSLQQGTPGHQETSINLEYGKIENELTSPEQKILKKQSLTQQLYTQYAQKLDEDFEVISQQVMDTVDKPNMDSYLNEEMFLLKYKEPTQQAIAKQNLMKEVKLVTEFRAKLEEEKERKKAMYKLWLESKEIASSKFDHLAAQKRVDDCVNDGICY